MGLPVYQLALDLRTATGGTVTQPSGGTPVAWTLPAGLYADYAAVLAGITTALSVAVPGAWGGTVNGYGASGISITHSVAFDLTVDATLQDWLSLPATSTSVSSVSSTAQPETCYLAEFPVEGFAPAYRHIRYQGKADGGIPTGGLIATYTSASWQQLVPYEDAAAWHVLRRYMARCVRCRVWLDRTVATAWSWTNRLGYVDLVTEPGEISYQWATLPDLTHTSNTVGGLLL